MRDKLRILNIPLKNDSHKQHDDQAEVLRGAQFRESIRVSMEAVLRTLMEGRPQALRDQQRNEQVLEEDDDEDFVEENLFVGLQKQI